MKILVFGGDSDIAKEIQRMEKNTILISHSACDIRKLNEVSRLLRIHKPKVVINCAGIIKKGSIKKQSSTEWENHIATNLLGSFHIAQACVKNNTKVIIFISSTMGLYGRAEYSAYSVSKSGVITLVQALALEGVDAYCISPGGVGTKMREKVHPGEDKRKRLSTQEVVKVLFDCMNGKYNPGDNIVIRKQNLKKLIKIDRGQPWKEYLHV